LLSPCLLAMSHGSKKRRYKREASIHIEEELSIGVNAASLERRRLWRERLMIVVSAQETRKSDFFMQGLIY
jgi:hypothetical protein